MLFKSIGFLLAGIIIALTFTLIPDTYSWFTREEGTSGGVKAATAKDIIDLIEVDNEAGRPIIRLRKAKDVEYSPVVFFSVEGEAEEYILHIDSVQLSGDEEHNLPIIPNINLPQTISLILSGKDEVKGTLYVKHLNQFINEKLSFSLSKDYLLETYFLGKGLFVVESGNLNISSMERDELIQHIIKTIDYTGNFIDLDEAEWEEWNNQLNVDNGYSMPISKLTISPYQLNIIDKITPNLIGYSDRLYSILEELIGLLNIKAEEINELTLENEKLIEKNNAMEEEIARLNNHISQLESEITDLLSRPIQDIIPPDEEAKIEEDNNGDSNQTNPADPTEEDPIDDSNTDDDGKIQEEPSDEEGVPNNGETGTDPNGDVDKDFPKE